MRRVFGSLNAKSSITGGAITLGFFYLFSAALGFFRDRFLAATFGAENRLLDSYYAAFRIPDFIFNVLVLGAVSAAFIPVFIDYYSKKDEQDAWKIANTLLNATVVLMMVAGIIIFVFAEPLLTLFTHGFKGEFATFLNGETIPLIDLTVKLTRLMLVASIFFGISSIAGAVQNSLKRFTLYAAAPAIYNLGIIFGVLYLAPRFDIFGVAYGVLVGSFAQMLLQLFSAYNLGFRHMWTLNLRHAGFIKMIRLMLFRAGALMVEQINLLVEVSVGSALPAGSIAFFTLANNLERLPATLFGISLATAVFPTLAESVSLEKAKSFIVQFSSSIRQILFMVVPISVAFILFRKEITALILSAGQFTPENARITASALGWFSVSLWSQALMPVTTRAFFSLKDTKTPFFVALFTMIVNYVVAVLVAHRLGLGAPGLAIAFSATSMLNTSLLLILLRRRMGFLDEQNLAKSTAKILISTVIMSGAVSVLMRSLGTGPELSKLTILVHLSVFGVVGGGLYFLVAWFLKSPEIAFIKNIFLRLRRTNG